MIGLPEGWEATTLGALIELKYGKSLPAKTRDGEGFPVYGSNGIVGHHSTSLTKGETIVVGRKGSIGEVHYSIGPCSPIDTTYFVDTFELTTPDFTVKLLTSLGLSEMNRATAIPGLNREDAYGLSVFLPPLAEQKRIVEKLDRLSAQTRAAKEHLNHVQTLAARAKQATLAVAFNPEKHRTTTTLDSAGKWVGGGTPSKSQPAYWDNGNVLWVSPKDMKTDIIVNTVDKITDEGVSNSSAKFIAKSSILIVTRSGILAHSVPTAIANEELTINQDLKAITPTNEFLSKFILYFLQASKDYILATCRKSGTTVQSLDIEKLKSLHIPKLHLSEQTQIIRRIEATFARIDKMVFDASRAAELLERLEQQLIAKAFRGELVQQDPGDEPASVLLERIKAERAKAPKAKRRRKAKT